MPVSRDKMGETYTDAAPRLGADLDGRLRGGGRVPADPARGHDDLRPRDHRGEARPAARQLSGDKAFALHDTYGFPIDLTLEMAAEQGLAVDEDGFRRLMTEQRQRAKADAQAKKGQHRDAAAYREVADALGRAGRVHRLRRRRQRGHRARHRRAGGVVPSAREGDEVELVLDRTPFYAEGGGQLADQGVIELDNGARRRGARRAVAGHRADRAQGAGAVAARSRRASAAHAAGRRRAPPCRSPARTPRRTWCTRRSARRSARPRPRPGRRTRRAGSASTSPRPARCPASVMADVEARVNDLVLADLAVHAEIMSQEEAVRSGAMALFGEKYGDQVRVISVGDWARELCGGTHAGSSGQLGVVKLLGESSIGSGVRRVEALVGGDAYRFLAREHVLVAQLSEALKVRPEQLPERVNDIVEKLRTAEKEIEKVRVGQLLAAGGELAAGATDVGGVNVVGAPRRRRRRRRRPHARARRARPAAARAARRGRASSASRTARSSVVAATNDEAASRGRERQRRWSARSAPLRRRPRRRQGRRRPGRRHRRLADRRGAGRWSRAAVGPGRRLGRSDAARRTSRHRSRGRPHRRRAQRPDRLPGDPGGDRAPRQGRPGPDRARWSPRRRRSRSSSGCPARCPGGEGPAAVKVREFAARLARRVAPVPVRLATSG